ncbi:hypothetical protein ACJX0J_010094, partial [Zea mays]
IYSCFLKGVKLRDQEQREKAGNNTGEEVDSKLFNHQNPINKQREKKKPQGTAHTYCMYIATHDSILFSKCLCLLDPK